MSQAAGSCVPVPLREAFVSAMRQAATGVSVVTTDGSAGRLAVTVSAVVSVSADPPLVLACIHRRSPVCRAIHDNGRFAVNLLAADQAHVADTFAGRPRCGAPFDFGCANWLADADGTLILEGAAAAFRCTLVQAHDAGSHTLFIGQVVDTSTSGAVPLVHVAQRYAVPLPLQSNGTH